MLVILSVWQPSDWQYFHPGQRPKSSKTTDNVYTCISSLIVVVENEGPLWHHYRPLDPSLPQTSNCSLRLNVCHSTLVDLDWSKLSRVNRNHPVNEWKIARIMPIVKNSQPPLSDPLLSK